MRILKAIQKINPETDEIRFRIPAKGGLIIEIERQPLDPNKKRYINQERISRTELNGLKHPELKLAQTIELCFDLLEYFVENKAENHK